MDQFFRLLVKWKGLAILSVVLLLISASYSQDRIKFSGKLRYLRPGVVHESKGATSDELQIYCYKGVNKHLLHIWQTVSMTISLGPEDYDLYLGSSPVEVTQKYNEHHSSWTFSFLTWKSKNIMLDPFNVSCVGIYTVHDYQVAIEILRIDFWKVLLLLFGVFLYFSAPKLSNNPLFYYICGITLGVTTSFLILIYLMSKLLPKKPLMYTFLLGGWTLGIYLFQLVWENVRLITVSYQTQAMIYATVTGFISFVLCYRFGPVTDPRSKNLIQWSLQGAGLCAVFFSSKFHEASVFIIIIMLCYHNFPRTWSSSLSTTWFKRFPPKRRLLTDDEYHEQSARETVKALAELRKHCSSPDCNQWKTVLRLKQPVRFAEFVEGKSHLADAEILEYESHPDKGQPSETDDSDSDSAEL